MAGNHIKYEEIGTGPGLSAGEGKFEAVRRPGQVVQGSDGACDLEGWLAGSLQELLAAYRDVPSPEDGASPEEEA